ncbi:MAG TPA: 2Fe-2S iron-sulfur cluster-binding protein, partial [Oscillospiraceae bacterium]|nr:2Fe-2S iron-sulfur cluster-binding protein [Oscillospiraceae bacterium]
MMLTVVCGEESRSLDLLSGGRLSDLLRKAGYSVPMPCGGCGRCGKCRIRVEGKISPATAQERLLLTKEDLSSGIRLACETEALGDVSVFLPEDMKLEALSSGILPEFVPDRGEGCGLAVDIGTTTLAAYLWDLSEGRLLSSGTAPNPQAAFGADVMTRLGASRDGHAADLAAAVHTAVCALADRIGEEAGLSGERIRKA